MNGREHNTLPARQAAARQLLSDTLEDLKNGLNPVIKKIDPLPMIGEHSFSDEDNTLIDSVASADAQIITRQTSLIESLHWAEKRATWTRRTQIDIKSYMASIYPAIRILKYDQVLLGEITYQHIDNILTQTFKSTSNYNPKTQKTTKITWSNYKKNRAKDYFSSYFGVLKEKQVIKDNPCAGMKDLPWQKKKEDAYSPEELQEIIRLLWAADPDYAIFMILFYDSGARETEFMKLRKEDVDLKNQVFKREILKGLHNKSNDDETPEGIISNASLPYWRKVLENCKDGDYLFSVQFRPGPKPIRTDIITKRWRKIVKPHFPNSRPYLMKHTNLTSITDQFGDNIAAAAAGHTSTDMIRKVYDKRRNQRTHEILKTKSNIHLLGAPELLPPGLPYTSHCATQTFPEFIAVSARPYPCHPCLTSTLIPAKTSFQLLAA
jgi:integrase